MNHIPSPDTSDAGIERLIQAKGKTAARVTPADVQANIAEEHYFTAAEGVSGAGYAIHNANVRGPMSLLTFCVLVLKNGFTVTGESACASPENFDAEIGRRIARENAVQKIWPLMGYELRSKLSETKTATKRYDWRAVQRFDVQDDMLTARLRYRVVMVDGAQFTGTVDLGPEAEVRERILEQCNTPKE